MTVAQPSAPARQIPIDLIVSGRSQARRHFDPERLAELAGSIRESGVVQPVVLRSLGDGRYELLAGERRWRAAQQVGLHDLPAIVRDDLDDDQASVLGLVENLQRESLSPLETANGLRVLAERFGLTHEQIARRIGKSRVYVTHFLRLLNLEEEVRDLMEDGRLSPGHAKALFGLTPARQRQLARQAVRENLSVRALERRAAAGGHGSGRALLIAKGGAGGDLRRLERALAEHLGYAVRLQVDAAGTGSLGLRFHSLDELDGLLSRLGYTGEP